MIMRTRVPIQPATFGVRFARIKFLRGSTRHQVGNHRCSGGTLYATMHTQGSLPRKSVDKPSKIKSGDCLTVKMTVNLILGSANYPRNNMLRAQEMIEWE